MTWLNKRKNMDTSGGRLRGPKPPKAPDSTRRKADPIYKVSEVMDLFKVDRRTVLKWMEPLNEQDPESSVIPASGWFKLPGGDIRIYAWAISKIYDGVTYEDLK